MPRFVVCEICFLLLLSGNGEEIGWLGSLHGGSDEGGGGIYGLGNFLGATTWRIRYSDGVIEKRGWCRRRGIILSSRFSVLSWLDLTTVKDL